MRFKLFVIIIISGLVLSCSKTNNPNNEDSVSIATKVTIIGRKNDNVFQVNIKNGTDVNAYNLTDELGVRNQHGFFGQNFNPYVSFNNYSNSAGSPMLWEKNLDTSSSSILGVFCDLDINETIHYPSNYEDYIFLLSIEPSNSNIAPFFNIRIYNKNSQNCQKIFIGQIAEVLQSSRNLLIDGNFLLVHHVNELYQSVITKVNLTNFLIEGQLVFEDYSSFTVNDHALHVFPGNVEMIHYKYDLNSFDLLQTTDLGRLIYLGLGFFDSSFEGDSMLLNLAYPQPAPIAGRPAFLNLDSGIITSEIDMYQVQTNLRELIPNISNFEGYQVDVANGVMVGLVSYVGDGTDFIYAIYYTDYEGNILNTEVIDIEPYFLLIR